MRRSQSLPEIQGRLRRSAVSILSFLLLTSLSMGARGQTGRFKSMKRKFLIPALGALISDISLLGILQGSVLAIDNEGTGQQTGMPIHFKAEKPGFITLVVEDKDGNRLKNLVCDNPVQAGDNVIYWDGSSMTGVASPGTYVVRGIFHEGITPHLEYSIYSPGPPPWPTAESAGALLPAHTPPPSAFFLPEASPLPPTTPTPVAHPTS